MLIRICVGCFYAGCLLRFHIFYFFLSAYDTHKLLLIPHRLVHIIPHGSFRSGRSLSSVAASASRLFLALPVPSPFILLRFVRAPPLLLLLFLLRFSSFPLSLSEHDGPGVGDRLAAAEEQLAS